MQHFVVDQPDRPQVRLGGVLGSLQDLRRHVERRSHNTLHDRVFFLETLRESKITDLAHPVLHEDIGRLKIPMDDSIGVQVLRSFHDLLQVFLGISLGQFSLL